MLKRLLGYSFGWLSVPIRGGPLQGRRWAVGSGGRFLQGTYERCQARRFQEVVRTGDVVYDIGAHVGYYSVLGSVVVGVHGRVFAFEPLAANLRHLRRNLRLNACQNVTVIEACVGERSGTCRFAPGSSSKDGHMAEDGPLTAKMVALDDLVRDGTILPANCIKIDVEGAEEKVLQGAESLIAARRPAIFLSIHGEGPRRRCFAFLGDHGYRLEPIGPAPVADAGEVLARGRT
jgi:FkbM family methyltransferase